MPWTWQYEGAEGDPLAGPSETFGSQADAESWLGQSWRSLSDAGVYAVVLLEDGRQEYRMSLQPATE